MHFFVKIFINDFKSYTGSRSGEYEEVRDQMHTKLLGNGTLLLQHVKEDREGFYLCQADNGIGTGLGKLIQLRVNCKYCQIGYQQQTLN